MGMIGCFKDVSPEAFEILKNNPKILEKFLIAANPPMPFDLEMLQNLPPEAAEKVKQTLQALEKMHSEMVDNFQTEYPQYEILVNELRYPPISVQKEWQAIHFLLSGGAWAGEGTLAKAILGGKEIGPDLGYGPVRYLEPQEVKDVDQALSQITMSDMKAKYDPEILIKNDIYPGYWELEYFDSIWSEFDKCRAYYQQAARNNKLMLLFVV